MNTNEIVSFVSDGFERAKGGEAAVVYAAVADIHNRNALPAKSHYPFGWIIYYALHQSQSYAIKERKLMLARYLKLDVEKPHKLHSMILTEAIRLYKDAEALAASPGRREGGNPISNDEKFSLVRFSGLWNLSHLRPGDWKRKEVEGRFLPSTVEKLITHYVDELYASSTPSSEEFMAIARRALADNPASDNLYAQISRLFELAGEKEMALEMMRKAILASSSKFYLWSRIADLLEDPQQTRLKVSLLYRALQIPGQDNFKGKVHLKLAKLLAEAESFAQAKWELEFVKTLYEKNSWNLPRIYKETVSKIPAETTTSDPTPIYRKINHLADDFIYESLPEVQVRKTYHKPSSPGGESAPYRKANRTAWRVTSSNRENYWLQPHQFNIPENLPLDTPLLVKIFNGKVVKAALPS